MKFELMAEHMIFQLIVFWFFFAVYRIVGFNPANFTFQNNRNNHADSDLLTTLWYTVAVHTRIGACDVLATSPASRAASALHALATFVFGTNQVVDLVSAPSVGGNM